MLYDEEYRHLSGAPIVTGLSPSIAPPNSKLTIRGTNLGLSQDDITSILICGAECLVYAEWISSGKIKCRCGAVAVGQKGDVIVTTLSGGRGSSTVQLTVFQVPVGVTDESAIWTDDSSMFLVVSECRRFQTTGLLGFPEGNKEAFSEEQLHDLFPYGSGNNLLENFESVWFLLENHHNTSFSDFIVGLSNLKESVSQKEKSCSHLKHNICVFVDCLDFLSELKQKLENEKPALENLDSTSMEIQNQIKEIFKDALERKKKADLIRRCQLILPRFRFIFNLPSSILQNIQKGDYYLPPRHYARFKLISQNMKIPVLQKVCLKVEEKIEGIRQMLLDKLKSLPPGVKEQANLIDLLVNLKTPGDVAWDSIIYSESWLLNMMKSSYIKHQTPEISSAELLVESLLAPICLQNNTPNEVQFITEVSHLLSEHFPNLWKLGQAYLSGKFHLMEELALNITNKFSELINTTLKPQTKNYIPYQQTHPQSLIPWLPRCFNKIRECSATLLKLDLPLPVVNTMKNLVYDIRADAARSLLKQTANDLSQMDKKEKWLVSMDDYVNKGLTQLPALFECEVVNALYLVCEMILAPFPKEVEPYCQLNLQYCIKNAFKDILHSFAVVLEKTAFNKEKQIHKRRYFKAEESFAEKRTFSEDEKLLIVLKNCDYTLSNILPHFDNIFKKFGYQKMIQGSEMYFWDVDKKLFKAYIEHKCVTVIKKIEEWMFSNQFSWDLCLKPKDVSVYVKKILMCLTEIHDEVYNSSPLFMARVLTKMLDLIMEEVLRLYGCVKYFEGNGNIQACLDLRVLTDVLSAYVAESSKKSFKACFDKITLMHDHENDLIDDLFREFGRMHQRQYICFERPMFYDV